MQINSINSYNYNNKYTNIKPFEAKNTAVSSPVSAKKDDKKTRNIAIASSIAGVLLLAFIFRKNIMKLFKGKKPTEPPKPPVEPPKPPLEPETPKFDGQKTLEEYRSIVNSQKPFPSNGSEEEKAAWNKIDERRMELRRELKTNNISIVLKKEYPLNPLEMAREKMEYLIGLKFDSGFNMSSQMDVINEYAKYGSRYWINKLTGHSFILDLYTVCLPLEMETTEEYKYKVAEKFIEIAERTTERDNTGMRDALKVLGILEDYSDVLDEKLLLRYIELLKKISFQQVDEYTVYYTTQHLQELPAVKQAMQEYHDILQQFPEKDKTKHD